MGQKVKSQKILKKSVELNKNENAAYQDMLDSAKAWPRGAFINLNDSIRKEERSQINNLNSYLKKLEREDQNEPSARRKKEIIKIRTDINK